MAEDVHDHPRRHAKRLQQVGTWLADKLHAIGGPELRAMYLECDAALDWSPDEPRLYALADRTRRSIADRHGKYPHRSLLDRGALATYGTNDVGLTRI